VGAVWSPDLYARAYRYAAQAHQGQIVPGTELPYLLHVGLVAMEVIAAMGHPPERDGDLAVACALLHDVLEDTAVTYDQLTAEFDAAVAQGVRALSKDPTLERAAQMPDSLRRISQQPHEVWMVKLADRITNLAPPPAYWTPAKIAAYREEAIAIHHELGVADTYLAARLGDKIEAYRVYLQRHG